jgi:UDPglucose--hexose-1-phosphate uridylyltransferase
MMTTRVRSTCQGYATPIYALDVSELRHDALTGRLVLLAPGRAARPHTSRSRSLPAESGTASAGAPSSNGSCPFCSEHEHETPPEIARIGPGEPDTPGWRVRVVPNLYPILGGPEAGVGAGGAHEVIVLSPDHDRTFGDLDDQQAVEVMTMLQERSRFHATAGRAYVQLLINHGREAGASIAHPHAQLLALDLVPPAVSVAVERFAATDLDLVLGDQSTAAGANATVVTGNEARAWCPTGSASPYEMRLATIAGAAQFAAATDSEILGAALMLRDVLARLERVLGDVPYNVVVHDAPTEGTLDYHWWIEIVPRTTVVAGFELGTGVLVNTLDPVDAAGALREA